MKKSKQDIQGAAVLLLAAFIWGTTYVFQSTGMDHVGPLTFVTGRNALSSVCLAVLWVLVQRMAGESVLPPRGSRKAALAAGLACGACLGFGMAFQQVGLKYTTVGKTSLISGLYIVFVPLIRMAAGKKYRRGIWVCVLMALAGLFLLTVSGDAVIRPGDVIIFFSAIIYSLHILVVDHYSVRVPVILLSLLQLIVATVIAFAGMMIAEEPAWADIAQARIPLLYAGILSGGVAFTLQITAQKRVEPAVASLIMCLEAVFGALAGWIVLHEHLTFREWCGAALMFAAIVLIQLMTAGGVKDSAEV